jgi:tripartite-type tricarboxylate transporter receptor subunit TctC
MKQIIQAIFSSKRLKVLLSATGILLQATAVDVAHAAQDSKFTENKVVTIYVSLPPGGSYDSYARLLSRHIGKNLPGSPSAVIVKNMPGGGGVTLANFLFQVAPKDGTNFGIFESGVPFAPILKDVPARYNSQEFGWLGSLAKVVPIVIARKDVPIATTSDLFSKELKVGASGAGSDTMGYPLILNHVLGTKFKIIGGYPGAADISLAIERGELDGYAAWCWDCMKAQKPDWVRNDFVRVLMQISTDGDKELTAKHVPTALELARSPEQKAQLRVALASGTIARPFTAPPGLEKERLDALRDAFKRTASDSDFLAEAERLQLPIDFVDGERLSAIIDEVFKTDPKVIEEVKSAWSGSATK